MRAQGVIKNGVRTFFFSSHFFLIFKNKGSAPWIRIIVRIQMLRIQWTQIYPDLKGIFRNTAYDDNLVATRSKTDLRSNFFTNRVVAKWNGLPTEVKDSRTLTIFKSKLDGLLN